MDETQTQVFRAALSTASKAVGIPLTDEQAAQCARYAHLLLTTNEQINLTRIVDPQEVAVKHFADSLSLLRALPSLASGARIADVGTGAGFPGLVIKIARPDLRVTLLDATAKRLAFLREVTKDLDLREVSLVHSRAEDAGRDPRYRDSFDLVTARAVAALPTLLEWCGPLVVVGGQFVAMKAASADDEKTAAGNAAQLLGLAPIEDISLTLTALPGDEEPPLRRLLVYQKRKPTPHRFPRKPAEIKSNPLS